METSLCETSKDQRAQMIALPENHAYTDIRGIRYEPVIINGVMTRLDIYISHNWKDQIEIDYSYYSFHGSFQELKRALGGILDNAGKARSKKTERIGKKTSIFNNSHSDPDESDALVNKEFNQQKLAGLSGFKSEQTISNEKKEEQDREEAGVKTEMTFELEDQGQDDLKIGAKVEGQIQVNVKKALFIDEEEKEGQFLKFYKIASILENLLQRREEQKDQATSANKQANQNQKQNQAQNQDQDRNRSKRRKRGGKKKYCEASGCNKGNRILKLTKTGYTISSYCQHTFHNDCFLMTKCRICPDAPAPAFELELVKEKKNQSEYITIKKEESEKENECCELVKKRKDEFREMKIRKTELGKDYEEEFMEGKNDRSRRTKEGEK